MKFFTKPSLLCAVAALAFAALGNGLPIVRSVQAQGQGSSASSPEAVEPDTHEFMEYVFQPTFGQLKSAMKEKPKDKKGWFAIKSGALILAEGGNLLLLRGPQDDRAEWNKYAEAVRSHGGALYQAAQKQDFESAPTHYAAMVKSCNACHEQFAHGEHLLTP